MSAESSPRRFILAALIVAVVLGIFFLPEILNLSKSREKPSVDRRDRPAPKQVELADHERLDLSPLQEVQYLLESGYIERLAAQGTLPGEFGEPPFTFDDLLRAGGGIASVSESARAELEQIAPDQVERSFALFKLIAACDYLQTAGRQLFNVTEAISFLWAAYNEAYPILRDSAALHALERLLSEVPRGDLRISEEPGPLLPRILLTHAWVHRQRNYTGSIAPNSTPTLSARAVLSGEEIVRLEVSRDGELLSGIDLRGVRARDGAKIADFSAIDARGKFTLVAFDKEGHTTTRNYVFYPRAAVFPWDSFYRVPFMGSARVDRFFSLQPVSSLMSAFSGGEIGRF